MALPFFARGAEGAVARFFHMQTPVERPGQAPPMALAWLGSPTGAASEAAPPAVLSSLQKPSPPADAPAPRQSSSLRPENAPPLDASP
eukprot:CAMPEP_0206277634 /NCGR_PEP_ID=MMETSP0047_2-20121206/36968_1 /ASSEMBLY_ACC=CAM_ASM_000192 /TAXON_ID=195065 /ORGANISM="Chroomonas mesostigmatica_cf, Strain CCMP1168" /LENGTH=87 /DNA_ID=CAMNT_0053707279 /DNA_START=33 /DNA_END=294 /DNA_ORIENTATION=-